MTITSIRKNPTDRCLELGGGSNPSLTGPNDVRVDVRACQYPNGDAAVDFVADFNLPLPIQDQEFDAVFSKYCIEHISYRKVPQFLGECLRVIKPGGKCVIITANTEAQFQWIQQNPNGWDGHNAFDSTSCVVFGDQDYPENSHKSYFSPTILTDLFLKIGFENVVVQPYGERNTDLLVEANRPNAAVAQTGQEHQVGNLKDGVPQSEVQAQGNSLASETPKHPAAPLNMTREEMYDKHYWNGGGKVGGYAREGYWDFPCHEVTTRHILARKPESVLELGCARGYILKRLQDAGVRTYGLEISKHCYMTRVADNIRLHDLCQTPWPAYAGLSNAFEQFDLAFSIATFEHIPEEHLPAVLNELGRTCRRGLHGIDFGAKDDGFDKTHCALKPKEWWRNVFDTYGLQSHEIVDKEELERDGIYNSGGQEVLIRFPDHVIKGDGKIKLNIGSFTTMYHNGWQNIDIHDLRQWAQNYGYNFLQHDVKQGLPHQTGTVDLIMLCHVLEHFTYKDGLSLLRECRRVIKPTGAMRIIVPDAALLMGQYQISLEDSKNHLGEFDEINDGCAAATTPAGKLWALLHEGHLATYDEQTLKQIVTEAGFQYLTSSFRQKLDLESCQQILRESLDMHPCLSLYAFAVP